MQRLLNSDNAVANVIGDGAAAEQSGAFYTTRPGKVWLHVYDSGGTFGVIKLQWKHAIGDAAWATFYPDGVEASYTSDFSLLMDLPGGLYWSFLTDTTTDSVPVYVEGDHIRLE